MPCGCCCAPTAQKRYVLTDASLNKLYKKIIFYTEKNPPGANSYNSFEIRVRNEAPEAVDFSKKRAIDINVSVLFFEQMRVTNDIVTAFDKVVWERNSKIVIDDGAVIEADLGNLFYLKCHSFFIKNIANQREFFNKFSLIKHTNLCWISRIEKGIHLASRHSKLMRIHFFEEKSAFFTRAQMDTLFTALGHVKTLQIVVISSITGSGTCLEDCIENNTGVRGSNYSMLSFKSNDEVREVLKMNDKIQDGIKFEFRYFARVVKIHQCLSTVFKGFHNLRFALSMHEQYGLDDFMKKLCTEISNNDPD